MTTGFTGRSKGKVAVGGLTVTGSGNVVAGGYVIGSTVDSIVAHSGGGYASAVALSGQYNRVTSAATASASVKLPLEMAGMDLTVINDAASAVAIYATGTSTIDGGSASGSVPLSAGGRSDFICVTSGGWVSKAGAKSA